MDTTGWPTYSSSSRYPFSIKYPPGFTVEAQGPGGAPGDLAHFRAVDKRNLHGYPPGQVELGIYTRDAADPVAWVKKHTGPQVAAADQMFYAANVTNLRSAQAVGRPAAAFDVADADAPSTHNIAFFASPAYQYVFLMDWWSTDPSYASTVEQYFEGMLNSYQD